MDVFKNLLLSNPRTYTGSGVGLLEASNNLSDVGDAVTAAGNLGVYTKAESNTRLNALAPRQGLWFEGPATGGRSASGTIPAAIGTSDVSVAFSMLVPPSTPATNIGIFFIGSGTEVVNSPYSFHVYLRSAGNFAIGLRGAAPLTEALVEVVDGFFTNYGGTFVNVVITRTGATVKCYINGVLQSFGTPLTAGTPPAWSDAFEGTGLVIGRYSVTTAVLTNAAISSLALYNFALPATTTSGVVGVAERYADGVWVRPSERLLGALTLGTFTNFSAGLAWESFTGTTTGFSGENTSGNGITISALSTALTAGQGVRVRGNITYNSGSGLLTRLAASDNTSVSNDITLVGGAFEFVLFSTGAAARLLFNANSQVMDVVVSDLVVERVGSTLDLQPQGIGRTIIDRSANRNHATVGGTTLPAYLQPTDGGKIVTRTNLATNQQLLALAAFDAANRYRITSWTVTAVTGTPEIDLGNVSAGVQYVENLTLATGVPTAVSLSTSIAATANLWINSDSTDVIIHTITYERISD